MVASPGLSIDELTEAARQRLKRLDPQQAQAAMRDGAILVDIRPQAQRQSEGAVPGALIVERNVLEWRFDPRSDARLPEASAYDLHVIIMCSRGYASSLAAASLQDLGLYRATDLDGGFIAWSEAGLPVSLADRPPNRLQDRTIRSVPLAWPEQRQRSAATAPAQRRRP